MTTNPADRETPQVDRLWTVQDTAAYLGVPVTTIYAWRVDGKGPHGRRVGKHLRYRPEDVRAWVEALQDPKHTA